MKDPLFCSIHTHTVFCDGSCDVETMCQAAYEKKLFSIGFSAHAPIAKKTGIKTFWNLPEEKTDEYADAVLKAKKRWKGKLKVFLGFEVDYIKGLRSPNDSDIASYNPDFLIGAVHFVLPPNGTQPFTVDGSYEELMRGIKTAFNGDAAALMNYYYDSTLEMLSLGGFDILAHADIIKKCCADNIPWNKEEEAKRQKGIAEFIANTAAEKQKSIIVEVNTGGINRGKLNETYPSLSFLKFLNKNKTPVIITADAHNAGHLTGNYDIAVKTLKEAGYKEHLIFAGKDKWVKQAIAMPLIQL